MVLGFITKNWIVNSKCRILEYNGLDNKFDHYMHRKCSHRSNIVLSAHEGNRILLFVILVPLLVMWMPLKNGNYGLEVALCWIRAFNESCEDVG